MGINPGYRCLKCEGKPARWHGNACPKSKDDMQEKKKSETKVVKVVS